MPTGENRGVYRSQGIAPMWDQMPADIRSICSLADGAYANRQCFEVARKVGATHLHKPRRDAIHVTRPKSDLQRTVNFATHWPNRSKAL